MRQKLHTFYHFDLRHIFTRNYSKHLYVLLFDESLNKLSQHEQIDVHVKSATILLEKLLCDTLVLSS